MSVEPPKVLNREWPHWSGLHPTSPVIAIQPLINSNIDQEITKENIKKKTIHS